MKNKVYICHTSKAYILLNFVESSVSARTFCTERGKCKTSDGRIAPFSPCQGKAAGRAPPRRAVAGTNRAYLIARPYDYVSHLTFGDRCEFLITCYCKTMRGRSPHRRPRFSHSNMDNSDSEHDVDNSRSRFRDRPAEKVRAISEIETSIQHAFSGNAHNLILLPG